MEVGQGPSKVIEGARFELRVWHLLVVVTQRVEAGVEVLVALVEEGELELRLLELPAQLRAHRPLQHARAERRRLTDLALARVVRLRALLLLECEARAELLERAVLVLQHLEQRAHVAAHARARPHLFRRRACWRHATLVGQLPLAAAWYRAGGRQLTAAGSRRAARAGLRAHEASLPRDRPARLLHAARLLLQQLELLLQPLLPSLALRELDLELGDAVGLGGLGVRARLGHGREVFRRGLLLPVVADADELNAHLLDGLDLFGVGLLEIGILAFEPRQPVLGHAAVGHRSRASRCRHGGRHSQTRWNSPHQWPIAARSLVMTKSLASSWAFSLDSSAHCSALTG